jgi:meso-butanediol dehydrogenase / (S,S)-butanediol dehydrogenase / diacetyl reductase
MRLQNLTALITGAASGIGLATAELFAEHGANVVLTDVRPDAAEAATVAIRAKGASAVGVGCDAANAQDVKRVIDSAVALFGGLNIVVGNAAAGLAPGPIDSISEADWDRAFAVNVKGSYLLAREALPHLRRVGGGSILFTASLGAKQGTQGLATYGATKAAIVNLVKSLALDHAAENIRVNAVCPGTVATPGLLDRDLPVDALVSMIPMGRLGRPDEIARAFLFLASSDASFITGQAIDVDGGMGVGMMAPRMPS